MQDTGRQAADLIFLSGQKLDLRLLTPADADGDYPLWLNQAEVCFGNSHHVYPYAREAAREYIAQANKSRDSLTLAIVNKAGVHVGNVALSSIHAVNRSAEFSILLGARSCWGQGFGREAALLMFTHGFDQLNLRRIACGTFSNNIGMQKIAHSLGMRQEGLRRQAVYKDGRYLDVLEYGILDEEFRAHHQAAQQEGT
ncbi:GNAT family protein [Massilia sp. W12]|uniref:GNAT family N-acetyltransferase n=1 Tax=Massilia sp. W12 TaxID=3126507 RepID=UPI0030CC5A55